MGAEEYEPPKKSIAASVATWFVPGCVIYVVCGVIFAKKIILGGPSGLAFVWTDDSSASDLVNVGFLVLQLVVLVVAFVVVRRRRRARDGMPPAGT